MARRKKRGDQQNQPQNNGENLIKKIEKRSARKKIQALTQAASASVVPAAPAAPAAPASVAAVPAPSAYVASAAPVPANGVEVVSHGRTEERGNKDRISGFIFMCNGATKPECYKYRVFGLPFARADDVEKIKEGTKLFLYDFDLKLLYGVYKAASNGGRNLEPAAFRSRFPAQVRFKIMTECLPLPESEFKHAILENYDGRKFRPELNNKQVKKLVAMFRPIILPPSGQVPHSLPNAAPPRANPPPPAGEWFQHPVKASVHAASSHIGHTSPLEARYAQHGSRPQNGSYYADPSVPYMPDKPALHAQDPYRRYMAAPPGMVHHDRLLGNDNDYLHHHSFLEREHVQHMDRLDAYYNQFPAQAASHGLPPQQYAPAPSYAPPTSHVGIYSNSTMTYEEPNRLYGHQSLQGPAAGVISHPGGNAPVTSRYSFAGPAPVYH